MQSKKLILNRKVTTFQYYSSKRPIFSLRIFSTTHSRNRWVWVRKIFLTGQRTHRSLVVVVLSLQRSLRCDFPVVLKNKTIMVQSISFEIQISKSVRRSLQTDELFKGSNTLLCTANFYARANNLINLIGKEKVREKVWKMFNHSDVNRNRDYHKSSFPSWRLNFKPNELQISCFGVDGRPLDDLEEGDRSYENEIVRLRRSFTRIFSETSFFFLILYFFRRPYTRTSKYLRWLKVVRIASRYVYCTFSAKRLSKPNSLKSSEKEYLSPLWSPKIPDVYLPQAIKTVIGTPYRFERLTEVKKIKDFKEVRDLMSFSNPRSLSRIFDLHFPNQKYRKKKRFRTINQKKVDISKESSNGLVYYALLRNAFLETILNSENNQDKSRTFCDILKLLSKKCKNLLYSKLEFSLQKSVSGKKLRRKMQFKKWFTIKFIKSFLKTPLSYRQPDKEFKKLLKDIFAAVLKCSQVLGGIKKRNDSTESITLKDICFYGDDVSPPHVQWIKKEFSPSFIPPYREGHAVYNATPEERQKAQERYSLNEKKVRLSKETFEAFSQVRADSLRYRTANCIFSLVLNFTKDKILKSVPAYEVEFKRFLSHSFDYTEVNANDFSIGEILRKEIKVLERSSTNGKKEILKMINIFDDAETFSFQLAEMAIDLFIKKDFFLVCNKSSFTKNDSFKTRKYLLFAEPTLMNCQSDVGLPEFVQAPKIKFADQVKVTPRKDGGFNNFELSVSAIEAINYSNGLKFSINENFVKLIAKILYETDQVPISVAPVENFLSLTSPLIDGAFFKRIKQDSFFFYSIARKTSGSNCLLKNSFLPFPSGIDLKFSASTIDQIQNHLEKVYNNPYKNEDKLEHNRAPLAEKQKKEEERLILVEKLKKEKIKFGQLRRELVKVYAQVHLAVSIKGYPIYFQNKLDFRGRMYPVNTVFSRTSGYAKHFVSGPKQKMTQAGFFYLASLLYGFSNCSSKHEKKIKENLKCGFPLKSFTMFLQKYVMNNPLTPMEQSSSGLYCELVKLELFMSCHSNTSSFLIEIDQKASAAMFAGFLFNNSKLLNNTCLKLEKNAGLMSYFIEKFRDSFLLTIEDFVSYSSKQKKLADGVLRTGYCEKTDKHVILKPLINAEFIQSLKLVWLFFAGKTSNKVHKQASMNFIFGQNSSTLGKLWVEEFHLKIESLFEEKIRGSKEIGQLPKDDAKQYETAYAELENKCREDFKKEKRRSEHFLRFMAKRYSSFLSSVLDNLPFQMKKLKKICDFLLRELGYVSYETLDGCKCKWYATTKVAQTQPKAYIEKIINVNTVYDFSNSTSAERSRYNFKVQSDINPKIASESCKVPRVNKQKSSSKFLGNLIHSMDASVLRIVLLKLKSKNIFASHNHDSFLVSPIHVDEFYNTLEEVYSNEVWNGLTLEKMYFDLNRKELINLYPKSSTRYQAKLAEYDSLVQDFQKTYTLDRNDSEIIKDLSIRSCYVFEH